MIIKDQDLTIVIFGGTGDLAQRKLMPALFDLYSHKLLPENFKIIGFARKELTDNDYRDFIKKTLFKYSDLEMIDKFIEHAHYIRGDINNLLDYEALASHLSYLDEDGGRCSHKIFHLAVSPSLYEPVLDSLSKSGLTLPCTSVKENERHWIRILVEKPFGNDLKHAEKLDKMLGKLFMEEQIFRIDHYLAKETVQNILAFRFANTIFSPLWNRDNIEAIYIRSYETLDIQGRGSYFDGVGSLRDVGQNHLLQMLALIAMEDPTELSADAIRTARYNVLRFTKPFSKKAEDYLCRGQYVGYLEEDNVEKNSQTETYFKMKLEVNTDRFKGIPFYIENGKALDRHLSEIEIVFKEKANCMCPKDDMRLHANKLIFNIQPNEGITIRFWTKQPGFSYELEEKDLSFLYDKSVLHLPDAYEKVLYDAIHGDQTLFTSTDEVSAQWNITAPIYKDLKKVELINYKKGTDPTTIKNKIQ